MKFDDFNICQFSETLQSPLVAAYGVWSLLNIWINLSQNSVDDEMVGVIDFGHFFEIVNGLILIDVGSFFGGGIGG